MKNKKKQEIYLIITQTISIIGDLVSSPDRCYISNLLKIGPLILDKKMLTDEIRLMTDDDRRQTIAIGHLLLCNNMKRQIFCNEISETLISLFNKRILVVEPIPEIYK